MTRDPDLQMIETYLKLRDDGYVMDDALELAFLLVRFEPDLALSVQRDLDHLPMVIEAL